MVKIEANAIVVDAGPLIHLDELQSVDLLEDLSPLVVPQAVWREVGKHRKKLDSSQFRNLSIVSEKAPISARLKTLAENFALDLGEIEALALAEQHQLTMFLTDDTAARLVAESLGFRVHGTIGLIVRAIRRRLRTQSQVVGMLSSIRETTTLHLSSKLLSEVLENIEKSNQ